jgi:hypothetical protein
MLTLNPACHFFPTPAGSGALPAPKPVRVLDRFIDAHHLPDGYDEAAMRFVQACDVQAGDLVVGILPAAPLAMGCAIPHAMRHPFTADPARLEDRPCDCRLCSSHASQRIDYRGRLAPVHLGTYTVKGSRGARRRCEVAYGPQWLCVIPADEEAPEAEFATLTVVVRRDGTVGDPCETVLADHPDVVFVGCEDGVSDVALALGADEGSWL